MRASLPALLFLAIAAIDETARAADTEDVALQAEAPQPPNLFRLPQDLFKPSQPPQPQAPPALPDRWQRRAPQLQAPRAVGPVPCVHYTMRIIPADPNVDPKFVKPAPDNGTTYSGHRITPPPACR